MKPGPVRVLSALVLTALTAVCPPLSAEEAESALKALETAYAEERAADLRRVLARYVDELEAMERTLILAGDTSGAARVRLERDRVRPALGFSDVAGEDAEDFAAFEDGPSGDNRALPDPGPGTSADLADILKTLQTGSAAPEMESRSRAGAETPGVAEKGRSVKRVLRMGNARLNGAYDPANGHQYWQAGSSASWTLEGLPRGTYQLVLRYAADEKSGGGKMTVTLGEEKKEVEVPVTGGWNRRKPLVIGPFSLTGDRMELSFRSAGSGYLMDLAAVLVEPVPAGANPKKP